MVETLSYGYQAPTPLVGTLFWGGGKEGKKERRKEGKKERKEGKERRKGKKERKEGKERRKGKKERILFPPTSVDMDKGMALSDHVSINRKLFNS